MANAGKSPAAFTDAIRKIRQGLYFPGMFFFIPLNLSDRKKRSDTGR
jgi:hypothetical protein